VAGFFMITFPGRGAPPREGIAKTPPPEDAAQRHFELAVARELSGDCC
jgi:hypothetical protein